MHELRQRIFAPAPPDSSFIRLATSVILGQYSNTMGPRAISAVVFVAGCAGWCVFASAVRAQPEPSPAPAVAASQATVPACGPDTEASERDQLRQWLQARLPSGGRIEEAANGALQVVHTTSKGDTASTIARAYLDLTDIYRAKDLAAAIAKQYPDVRPGTEVRIPSLLAAPYRSPDDERRVWPADRVLRGIYVTGETAGSSWPETIERVQSHGMNAIVLDAKNYSGGLTYPSHVPLALRSGAAKAGSIPDYSRAIRFAHARGITVIARITCFHDPWMAGNSPNLAIRGSNAGPAGEGWLDPGNVAAQDYLVDIVKEVVDLGADEVQLDYVRFPVQDVGDAKMLPPDGHRSRAITSFVSRVREAGAAKHVPISLDVFGFAASGPPGDIEALGQNLKQLGPVSDAISPMVYPSHYPVGFQGLEKPGDHPELVRFGTRAAVGKMVDGHAEGTIIRPWLQAAAFRTTAFGPKYIQDEIRYAEEGGGVGWLMWDAGNNYWAVWKALPEVHDTAPAPGETALARHDTPAAGDPKPGEGLNVAQRSPAPAAASPVPPAAIR
jgi:hypothetical protein